MIKISPLFFSSTPEPEKVAALLQSTLDRADPYEAVRKYLQAHGKALIFQNEEIPFKSFGFIFLLSIGKAAILMAKAATDHFSERITTGLVVYKNPDPGITFMEKMDIQMVKGDHPIPGENSLNAGKAVINLVGRLQPDDLLLTLISGGGSALHIVPQDGVSTRGLQDLSRKLLACGTTIQEMNIIRRHLDKVKGGGLLKLINHPTVLSLIVSDVIGNDLRAIGSGITATDDSTFHQAIQILRKYQLEKTIDPAILDCLVKGQQGLIEETLKPGDARVNKAHNEVILSNSNCVEAGEQYARKLGWNVIPGINGYMGEAKEVGKVMAKTLVKMAEKKKENSKPLIAIYGGEATVHITGKGKGGRNLELALSAVEILERVKNAALVSFTTDGEDGPTDAAGAVVTGETAVKAKQKGLDPKTFLANNDSYRFFQQVGGLIKTGPTGTNVNDLVFLIAF